MLVARKQRAKSLSSPAPIGGLNAHDALAEMPPNDAVILDNFFPTPTSVDLRKGYTVQGSGLPAHVESLMPYAAAAASKLFAASGTAFYEINLTTPGAVGAAAVSGLTNARWQTANMGTPGGQFMVCVNGADSLRLYDGSTWTAITGISSPAITGVTTSSLINVAVYKNRIYLIQAASFVVWYLPINSIAGAAASLDLSPLFKKGGYLMQMATWTIDNSSGIQEYAVFISSEGEVAMYQGTDPSNSGSWYLVGMFNIGRPVGRRCTLKVGSDVILIGADGFFPLSKALLTDRSQLQDALSDKIINLVNNDVQNYFSNYGWEGCLYPIGNKLIINIPQQTNKTQYQYVMNTVTGAWCRFTGWNANCFAVLGNYLYFGGNLGSVASSAYVAKADVGFSDNGAYINGEAKTAFRYFGATGQNKRFTMVRPIFQTAGVMQAALAIDTDFKDIYPTASPTFSGTSGTAWTSSLWNTFPWGDVSSIKKDWQGVNGVGFAGALHMRIVNNASAVQWQSVEYVYEIGGVL